MRDVNGGFNTPKSTSLINLMPITPNIPGIKTISRAIKRIGRAPFLHITIAIVAETP